MHVIVTRMKNAVPASDAGPAYELEQQNKALAVMMIGEMAPGAFKVGGCLTEGMLHSSTVRNSRKWTGIAYYTVNGTSSAD
jgi:hypothetical protein